MEEFNEELEEKIDSDPESEPESEPEKEPEQNQEPDAEPEQPQEPEPDSESEPEHKEDSSDVSKDTSDEKSLDDNTEMSEYISQAVEDEYIEYLDESVSKVIERINALIDTLAEENEVETLSEVSIPINGYRDWNYGINVKFKIYPYGAGYYMDSSVYCSDPADFEEWYIRTSSLINDTIRDFYILTVTDDNGFEVYNHETYVDTGDSSGEEISIPIEGYRDWNYGITVEYKVYPYGAGYYMNLSESCLDINEFEEWYKHNAALINDTLKDFYILSVIDCDGIEVYNHETYAGTGDGSGDDDPDKDKTISGEYLEILKDIYAELEIIKESEKESQLLTDDYRNEMLNLQIAETGSSIIICVVLFIISAEIAFREILARLK